MSPGTQTAREVEAKITNFSNSALLNVLLKVTGLYLCGQYVLKHLIRLICPSVVSTSSIISQFVKESKVWYFNFTFHSQIGQQLSQKLEGTPMKREGLCRLILSAIVHISLDFKTMQAEICMVHQCTFTGNKRTPYCIRKEAGRNSL